MCLRATSRTETSVYNSLPMLLLLLALYIIVMWRCFKMPLNVPGIYLLLAMKYFLLLLIHHWFLLISFFFWLLLHILLSSSLFVPMTVLYFLLCSVPSQCRVNFTSLCFLKIIFPLLTMSGVCCLVMHYNDFLVSAFAPSNCII